MRLFVILVTMVLAGASALGAACLEPSPHANFLELRIYQAHEVDRDKFLKYFEEHFLESQEEVGMRIWGQYRDLRTPKHFVWMRGYETMEERPEKLMEFYTGPVWQARGPGVREMLVSARHVHLLEPVDPQSDLADAERTKVPESDPKKRGIVVVEVFLNEAADLLDTVRSLVVPTLEQGGGVTLGLYRSTEHADNFPALPFITDEKVIAWIGSFESVEAYDAARQGLSETGPKVMETLVLEPGARSRLFHRAGED